MKAQKLPTKKAGVFNCSPHRSGFTLIELLFVISIISLLSSVIISSTGPVRAKARDARRQQDIRNIYNAVYLAAQNGKYPLADWPDKSSFTTVDGDTVYQISTRSTDSFLADHGQVPWAEFEAALGQKLPKDPINFQPPSGSLGARVYIYTLYFDSNNKPLTLYFSTVDCKDHIMGPGSPRQGLIGVGYLEVTPGNVKDQYLGCPFYNPEIHGKAFRLDFDGI